MAWAPDPAALRGRVAVVAGATRGAGRGIAAALGEAGATVICTGRSSRTRPIPSDYHRAETIEETADWSYPGLVEGFPLSLTPATARAFQRRSATNSRGSNAGGADCTSPR